MPEPYDWEWLKQPPQEATTEEHDARQLRNLRRWVDPVGSEQLEANAAQSEAAPKPHRLSREQRRQQLRQLRIHSVGDRPEPTELPLSPTPLSPSVPCQPDTDCQQTVHLHAEHDVSLAHPGALPPLDPLPEPTPQPVIENCAKKTMAKKKDDYRDHLKQEFNTLFDNLSLQPQQKHYLKSRWLDQVLWMEGRAGKARDMHYRLRLTTIIGGVIIPALVSLNFTGNDQAQLKQAIAASTFVLSQAVAICAATEQFFNYGDRWRHYRRSVESLKTQGWQFFELTGPYENSKTHEQGFSIFANQVEQILQHDVEIYSTQVAQAKQNEKQEEESNSGSGASVTSSTPANGRVPDAMRQP